MAVREQNKQASKDIDCKAGSDTKGKHLPHVKPVVCGTTSAKTPASVPYNFQRSISQTKGSRLAQRRGFTISSINTNLTNVKNTEDLRQEQMSGDDLDALFSLASCRNTPSSADSVSITISPVVAAELSLSLTSISEERQQETS
eukprot:m.8029 g.8029  ORF g.8029 m.8029 type:complete len:144 (-) comp9003_c0_seq1:163-594(-)